MSINRSCHCSILPATGPHVGLVQLLPNAPLTATFSLTYSCQGQYDQHCTTSQQVLIGVMGIRQYGKGWSSIGRGSGHMSIW